MANDKDFIVKNAVELGKDTKVTLGTITSSDIDLSTGNYFSDTLAANTTYTISNAGDVQSFQLEVTGGLDLSNAYDMSTITSVYATASSLSVPSQFWLSSDGTTLYEVNRGATSYIRTQTLSTAWDISTISGVVDQFTLSDNGSYVNGAFIGNNGYALYAVDQTNDTVYQYTMTTAYDITTASSASKSLLVSGKDTVPTGLWFKPDGTEMYLTGDSSDDIHQYTLSTAWDVSTGSFTRTKVLNHSNTGAPFFTDDGVYMFTSDANNSSGSTYGDVRRYTLTTPWDISTAGSIQSFQVTDYQGASGIGSRCNYLSPDGAYLYVVDNGTDKYYQFSMASDATLTWPSSIEWAGGLAPAAPATGETDVFTIITDDGGTTYTGVKTADNLS